MSQYRAYPAYKDSGVEWIGQVPEHWEVKPICRVTSVNDDVLPDSTTDDTPIRYVDISSVGYMEGIKQASDMCFADAPSRARRKASSGDVIISTVRTYLKAVAAVTDEYADCVFSTGFAVLRARHLDRSFLKWMVLNELLIQAIEAHSEGLSYPAINASALVKLKSVIPPPEEQASIAATLDLSSRTSLETGIDFQTNEHTLRSASGAAVASYDSKPRMSDMRFFTWGLFGELSHELDAANRLIGGLRVDASKAEDQRTGRSSSGQTDDTTLKAGFLRWENAFNPTTTLYAGLGHTERAPDYWERTKSPAATSMM